MPLYEYRCPSCNDRFERLARFSDGLEADCPQCGSVSPRVLSTFAAFVSGSDGSMASVGGGCACASGGSCACAMTV